MEIEKILEQYHQGYCLDIYQLLGAHMTNEGVRFVVDAPNAKTISVIGSFNDWNVKSHPMQKDPKTGLFMTTISNVKEWDSYKFHIETYQGKVFDKADPYAFYSETRPNNASKIFDYTNLTWNDQSWLQQRDLNFHSPLNIYEVYAGGWKKNEVYSYNYQELENTLIPYVKENHFTHIEFMPLNEYPFDGSWGYQAHGYYSVTSRYGNPREFAHFVDVCHQNGIGVIIDMVPVHFVKDSFGLIEFDGTKFFEYQNDQDAQSEWGTCNFNLWKEEVRCFLMSCASFWAEAYHVDGIRIDAVSNLIYWGGNKNRGVNEGALHFIKRMNYMLKRRYPSLMMIAEDSSDYAGVTKDTAYGGLGFDYKWDLGWMNDTLKYFSTDPLFRHYDHHKITFSMAYFYSERFILPFSHDENVHSKGTIIDRMWGSYEQKFAQVKALYAYMFAHPGKKLNFMGNEIATFREFDESKELDWFLLTYPRHDSFYHFFQDLNAIYLKHPSLSEFDYEYKGFCWIDADNTKDSVYSFYRENDKEIIVFIMNCANQSYHDFKINVPKEGVYTEILNTEKDIYNGNNLCNPSPMKTRISHHKPYILVQLAPFSATYLYKKKIGGKKA